MNIIREALSILSTQKKSSFSPKYFKTEKGEYGEGNLFSGVTVSFQITVVAKEYFIKRICSIPVI